MLDIRLPRQQPGIRLATQIAKLAASYQLNSCTKRLDEATRQLLTKLQDPLPLQPVPKQFASYFLIGINDAPMMAAFRRG